MVPTSANTGEGLCDFLRTLLSVLQRRFLARLETKVALECTVMEVREVAGMGTTVDVLLRNGALHEGDHIVLAGLSGPISTTIRSLLTPQPLKEMRVKCEYAHHAKIGISMVVKISTTVLEKAVCGSEVLVSRDGANVEVLNEKVQTSFESILQGFDNQSIGVFVKASTIGSLVEQLKHTSTMVEQTETNERPQQLTL